MNKPLSEFVIWGKAPGAEFESLLVSEHAGLRDIEHANQTIETLTEKHGCTACRVQKLAPLTDAREVAAMFGGALTYS